MIDTLMFSSPRELAEFLWGPPASGGKAKSEFYDLLIAVKTAWLDPSVSTEVRAANLRQLTTGIRGAFFHPPRDESKPGDSRELVALAYRSSEGQPVFWTLAAVPPASNPVQFLRRRIDAEMGPGFFAQHIVAVNRMRPENLLGQPAPSTSAPIAFEAVNPQSSEEVV